jgi:hypothetical protein
MRGGKVLGRLRLLGLGAGLLLAVSGCQSGSPGETSSSGSASVVAGSGCGGDIARLRTVVTRDLASGDVNRTVHDRIMGELNRAAAACSAGRDAEAADAVRATKQRFGYP